MISSWISADVRKPILRSSGSGGHQPCNACWSRNAATTRGSARNFRLTQPEADAGEDHR